MIGSDPKCWTVISREDLSHKFRGQSRNLKRNPMNVSGKLVGLQSPLNPRLYFVFTDIRLVSQRAQ